MCFLIVALAPSSGTSKIGNCGGIDNPTHYTRLKKLRKFIETYVDDKHNLCFVDGTVKEVKACLHQQFPHRATTRDQS
jgi:hypothetical protein